jgi:rare lipoprotein A
LDTVTLSPSCFNPIALRSPLSTRRGQGGYQPVMFPDALAKRLCSAQRGRARGMMVAAVLLPWIAACSGGYRPVSDYPVRIGRPYTVRGVTYTPVAAPGYEAVGLASWYGNESGNRTANGEKFRAKAITGAHTTLPLPSYVEVTALATGRTTLVRVNDRGPFARGRIIDLSRGAARLLGVTDDSAAAVHLRVVNPPEKDRERLRKGKAATRRPDASPAQLEQWRNVLAER